MDQRPIRVACLGAGWAARNRHLPGLRDHGGYELVAVVDPNPGRAESLARELGVPRHFQASAVSELPVADELDAVVCATPPLEHAAVIADALDAGKHVLSDKPLAVGAEQCERLVDLAAQRGLALCAVLNFQFARSTRQAAAMIDRGELGRTVALWAIQLSNPRRRLPDWIDDLPLGLFYDESPHLLSLAQVLAPATLEPLSATVVPSTAGLGTPAHVSAQMVAAGVPVTLQMSFEAPLSEWHLVVLGERGFVAIDLFRDIAVSGPNDGPHQARQVARTSLATTLSHWRGYLRSGLGHARGRLRYGADEVYRRFHDAVHGREATGIEAVAGLEVARLQDWIIASA